MLGLCCTVHVAFAAQHAILIYPHPVLLMWCSHRTNALCVLWQTNYVDSSLFCHNVLLRSIPVCHGPAMILIVVILFRFELVCSQFECCVCSYCCSIISCTVRIPSGLSACTSSCHSCSAHPHSCSPCPYSCTDTHSNSHRSCSAFTTATCQ